MGPYLARHDWSRCEVSAQNSLVGSTAGDGVGRYALSAVTPLSNGNYVVNTPAWHDANGEMVGVATWVDGSGPRPGTLTAGNSLMGSPDDGPPDVTALTNGNYVVSFFGWDRGPVTNAGAVVWGDGTAGTTGTVSARTRLSVRVRMRVMAIVLTDGNYVVAARTSKRRRAASVPSGSNAGWNPGESTRHALIGSPRTMHSARQVDTEPPSGDGRFW